MIKKKKKNLSFIYREEDMESGEIKRGKSFKGY